MRTQAAIAFLCCALHSTPAHAQREIGARVHVEVLHGRVVLHGPDQDALVLARGARLDAARATRIEVGAGAEATLHKDGALSLRVVGPGELDWSFLPAQGPWPRARLAWQARAQGALFLEARGVCTRLDVGGGWSIELERGALRAGSDARGEPEVENLAGFPLRLVRRADPFVEPARWLAVAERTSLASALTVRGPVCNSTSAAPWVSVSWPFGTPDPTRAARPPAPAVDRGEPAELAASENRSPALVRSTGAYETSDPVDRRAELTAPREVDDPQVRAATELSAEPDTSSPARRAVPVEAEPQPFDPAAWRGLQAHELARVGAWVVERSSAATILSLADGRQEVALSSQAPRSIFGFGAEHDVELFPGALVVIDQTGRMDAHAGRVRIHAARPGRAASHLPGED